MKLSMLQLKFDGMFVCSHIFPIVISGLLNQLMNTRHVLFHLPNLLKLFPTELARQLLFVDFPFLSIVNMFYVGRNVVAVQEKLSAYLAGIVSFACMRFHVTLHFRLRVTSANERNHLKWQMESLKPFDTNLNPQTVQTTSFSDLCTNMCLLSVVSLL